MTLDGRFYTSCAKRQRAIFQSSSSRSELRCSTNGKEPSVRMRNDLCVIQIMHELQEPDIVKQTGAPFRG